MLLKTDAALKAASSLLSHSCAAFNADSNAQAEATFGGNERGEKIVWFDYDLLVRYFSNEPPIDIAATQGMVTGRSGRGAVHRQPLRWTRFGRDHAAALAAGSHLLLVGGKQCLR